MATAEQWRDADIQRMRVEIDQRFAQQAEARTRDERDRKRYALQLYTTWTASLVAAATVAHYIWH